MIELEYRALLTSAAVWGKHPEELMGKPWHPRMLAEMMAAHARRDELRIL